MHANSLQGKVVVINFRGGLCWNNTCILLSEKILVSAYLKDIIINIL